jgi:hypothetical protein
MKNSNRHTKWILRCNIFKEKKTISDSPFPRQKEKGQKKHTKKWDWFRERGVENICISVTIFLSLLYLFANFW